MDSPNRANGTEKKHSTPTVSLFHYHPSEVIMATRLISSFRPDSVRAVELLLAFLTFAFLFSGCAANISRPAAATIAKLQSCKTFYIVQSDTDNRGISTMIQKELTLFGKQAISGPRSSIPSGIDAIVTYYEDWKWDLTWYLLNLLIQFRDPETNVLLGSAASYRTSLARTDPQEMVWEVLYTIFKYF
jgi:hypothetical protein